MKAKIFTLSCITYIISAFFGTLTSVLASYYMGDIHMSTQLLGIFFAMGGLLTAIAMSLPGRLVDKIGAKKAMIINCIVQLITFGLLPLANSAVFLMIIAAVHSLAVSLETPCNTQALRALGVKEPAKLLSINMVGTSLAGIVASALAPNLIKNAGLSWRSAIGVFFAFSVILGILGIIVISSVKVDFTSTSYSMDNNKNTSSKSYRFTNAEKRTCLGLAMLYIEYMGVGISLSSWLPTLLSQKGFDAVAASMPTTISSVVMLICYFLLPTAASKLIRSTKVTPAAASLNILCVLGMLLSDSLVVICFSRGALAVIMAFLFMHIQSDMALVAPKKAAGRYSSIISSVANAGGVLAIILMGFLPTVASQLAMLCIFITIGVLGSIIYISPAKKIMYNKDNTDSITA